MKSYIQSFEFFIIFEVFNNFELGSGEEHVIHWEEKMMKISDFNIITLLFHFEKIIIQPNRNDLFNVLVTPLLVGSTLIQSRWVILSSPHYVFDLPFFFNFQSLLFLFIFFKRDNRYRFSLYHLDHLSEVVAQRLTWTSSSFVYYDPFCDWSCCCCCCWSCS